MPEGVAGLDMAGGAAFFRGVDQDRAHRRDVADRNLAEVFAVPHFFSIRLAEPARTIQCAATTAVRQAAGA